MADKKTIEIPDFQGFSPKAAAFLKSLKRNNRREWFQPRKDDYEQLLHLPMMALVCELAEECKSFAPEIRFDPRKSLLRIYRDTRFSKDKTPYKDFVAAKFPFGTATKDVDSLGFYIHFEPGDFFIGGGIYKPSTEQLRKIREMILQNPDAFTDIVENRVFKKHFGEIQGEKLKKVPAGISADHELAEYFKLKQFFVSISFPEEAAYKKDLPKKIAKEFKEMMVFARWLNKSQSLW